MKKLLIIFSLISYVSQVEAIYISEVMYDPLGSDTSREWIEIFNDTSGGVDITSWKFFESNTNHSIASYSGGSILPVGGYAVIVDNPTKFLEDNPNYSGIIYDSAFSLSNSGEHVSLKQTSSGQEVDATNYTVSIGGNNDGSTLSKIDSVWVRGSATPGNTNQLSVLEYSTTSSSVSITNTQATVAQMSAPLADIVLYLPQDKIVIAGADTNFSVFGLNHAGKNIDNLTYTWAYGDGGQGVGSSTIYRYAYPGKYVVSVEGTNGYVTGTGRMLVRVVTPEISIAKIGTGKYGKYIDISNSNNYELDLSQWKLSVDGANFSFPKNTVLASNSVTHISSMAMGFASTTISTSTIIKILFPTMEEVTRYVIEENVTEDNQRIVVQSGREEINKVLSSTKLAVNNIQKKISSRVIEVSTSTNKNSINSTSTNLTHTKLVKDTRLIAFFKSIFGNK